LIYWLKQFPNVADRETAYQFVRKKLIYINPREMLHLVGLSMPEIKRAMRRKVGTDLGLSMHRTWGHKLATDRLKVMYERTLYVGLSDGAKIDSFRRYNEGAVSNEQIVASAEISVEKWGRLTEDLRKRLDKRGLTEVESKFERVCLIDDFTASGSTLIRKKPDGTWTGKIPRFLEPSVLNNSGPLSDDCTIHAHHYIATAKAKDIVEGAIAEFAKTQKYTFELTYSTILESSIVISDNYYDTQLVNLIKQCYDAGIEDDHTDTDIWYGYKQCGLPLVLDHNTPNNSIALLWASTDPNNLKGVEMHPLFPRIKRHAEHGQSV
jgi:hypothetical protein